MSRRRKNNGTNTTLIEKYMPEKVSYNRKIHHLYDKNGVRYYRVNYHHQYGTEIKSFYLEVNGDNVEVIKN